MKKHMLRTLTSLALVLLLLSSTAMAACSKCGSKHDYYSDVKELVVTSDITAKARSLLTDLGYKIDQRKDKIADSTKKAIEKFQHENNLTATGKLDACTMDRIRRRAAYVKQNQDQKSWSDSFSNDYTLLSQGSKGARVRALNDMLRSLGFDAPYGDKYTGQTTKAVKAFQTKYLSNYPIDGICGPLTLSKLETLAKKH